MLLRSASALPVSSPSSPYARTARTAVALLVLAATCSIPAAAQTNYGPGTGGTIPDNTVAGISSIISVSGTPGTVVSLDAVTINGLTHTWVGDLVATLSHGGVTIDLFDRVARTTTGGFGNSGDFTGGPYVFALTGVALPTSGNVVAGTYLPFLNGTAGESTSNTGSLSSFNGMDASGDWTLNISDRATAFTGTYTSWSLTVTTAAATVAVPEPGTLSLALFPLSVMGTLALRRARATRRRKAEIVMI